VIRVLSSRLSDTMKQIQQRRKALGESWDLVYRG
jgi:hypothetical protein